MFERRVYERPEASDIPPHLNLGTSQPAGGAAPPDTPQAAQSQATQSQAATFELAEIVIVERTDYEEEYDDIFGEPFDYKIWWTDIDKLVPPNYKPKHSNGIVVYWRSCISTPTLISGLLSILAVFVSLMHGP